MLRKRTEELDTVDNERQALAAQRQALEDLRAELVERIAAVNERESELRAALAQVAAGGSPKVALPPLPADDTAARAAALDRRAAELEAREQAVARKETAAADDGSHAERARELERRAAALDERERELERRAKDLAALPPPPPDEARLATIEARLAELADAEKAFLRTQQELAARSEALSARERLVAQKERELDEREDGWGGPADLRELESRLRRLETTRASTTDDEGFAGGFRKLATEGTRKRPA